MSYKLLDEVLVTNRSVLLRPVKLFAGFAAKQIATTEMAPMAAIAIPVLEKAVDGRLSASMMLAAEMAPVI